MAVIDKIIIKFNRSIFRVSTIDDASHNLATRYETVVFFVQGNDWTAIYETYNADEERAREDHKLLVEAVQSGAFESDGSHHLTVLEHKPGWLLLQTAFYRIGMYWSNWDKKYVVDIQAWEAQVGSYTQRFETRAAMWNYVRSVTHKEK
jgi:hypothetical protein